MTKFTLNDKIIDLLHRSTIPSDIKNRIIKRNWISHKDLITIYRLQFTSTKDQILPKFTLLRLLKDSKVYTPPPVTQPKSPEFLRQMEKLRIKQQEYEYRQLIAGKYGYGGNTKYGEFKVTMASEYDEYDRSSPSQQAKELKHQLTTILNILISVVSVGYAVWYWTATSMRINDAYRILLSLFFSILVLVAEVVVFGGYLRKVDDAKKTERSKKEVRKIVDTVTFGGKKN